jgi:hypothetical protein
VSGHDLVLHVLPDRVYRDPHPAGLATMSFWLWVPPLVAELAPKQASIRLMTADDPVESRVLEAVQLTALAGRPPRFSGHEGGLWLSHQVTAPREVPITSIAYELDVRADGADRHLSLEVKVADYGQRSQLTFPVAGSFAIVFGHASEGDHVERSQAFAYDIAPLGPRYELLRDGDGSENAHFAGWERAVRAPAAGVVVRVQADVPDNPAPGQLSDLDQHLAERWAVAGNGLVIDHGNSEFSLLGHMRQGSVTVRHGERVHAGQTVGKVGNSGQSTGPHLHYHLMDGPELFRSNGLPSRFTDTETETPRRGAMEHAD